MFGLLPSFLQAPAGGGGGAGRSDTFARSDSSTGLGTPSDGGSAWVQTQGTNAFGINDAAAVNITTSTEVITLLETGLADASTTITMGVASFSDVMNADASDNMGIVFRGVDANNFLLAYINGGSRQATIFTKIAGTFTSLTTSATNAFSLTDVPCQFKVTYSGTSITFYKKNASDGAFTSICSTTSSQFQTATLCGLRTDSIDPLRVEDFTVA